MSKKRYHLIDAVRGLSIILMVFHHFAFSLLYFGFPVEKALFSPVVLFLSPLFAGVFILISGMSCRFSRSNIKRGLITFFLAILLTVVSGFFSIDIWFGILHFLGMSMFFYGILSHWLDKIPLKLAFPLWTLLFIIFFIKLPVASENNWFYWLGFYSPVEGISAVDYFPFGKWFFLFLLGTCLGKLVKDGRFPKWFYSFNMPFFPFVGRHTLIIYLLHQPFFYVILSIYTFLRR